MSALAVPDRDGLAAFVGRVVQLDPAGTVLVRSFPGGVAVCARTPFETLAAHAVPGSVTPASVTVRSRDLLAALAVARGESVDPGPAVPAAWPAPLPSADGWRTVDKVPAAALAAAGLAPEPLDEVVHTSGSAPDRITVPRRALLTLSALALLDPPDDLTVSVDPTWTRLAAESGAVIFRRRTLLPMVQARVRAR